MTFTVTKLVNERAMIIGTDKFGVSGKTIVSTEQWDEVNSNTAYDQATEAFDAAVKEFFAPLTEASEKLVSALEKPEDETGYVVLNEGAPATPGEERVLIKLTRDSMILRLIEEGKADSRLVWVNDELEVLEPVKALSAQSVPAVGQD